MADKINLLVLKEWDKLEQRVSATIETVKLFEKLGVNVNIESGAGEKSNIIDREYDEAGAGIQNDQKEMFLNADIIISVNPPEKKHIKLCKENACWISTLPNQLDDELVSKMTEKKMSFFSMNLIPRITRAQKMDSLSSQSNIAGYKAVILAAEKYGKIFPLMMTAAGTIHPAKVVILGAGVAGLQAIATAKRLGAIVEASDVRPVAKEQVESLGAKFIEVEFEKESEDKSGYAKEASKEFLKKQAEEVSKHIKQADIVISTALVPGKKAPLLITEDMVKSMKRGSVIVDLATSQGGNCEISKQDKIVNEFGITIIGISNIPATVPIHSSEMFAKNIYHFVSGIIKEGKISVDLKDEIYNDSLITHNGLIVNKAYSHIEVDEKND